MVEGRLIIVFHFSVCIFLNHIFPFDMGEFDFSFVVSAELRSVRELKLPPAGLVPSFLGLCLRSFYSVWCSYSVFTTSRKSPSRISIHTVTDNRSLESGPSETSLLYVGTAFTSMNSDGPQIKRIVRKYQQQYRIWLIHLVLGHLPVDARLFELCVRHVLDLFQLCHTLWSVASRFTSQ